MLEISIQKRLGETQIDLSFTTKGRATGLFGPSGSGKTSTLNMLAGLIEPDRGRISVGEKVLFDSEKRIDTPVHKRRMGYVFQEHRLFPHLSVTQNLDYGRRMSRLPIDTSHGDRVVATLGIEHLLDRRPNGLSGGEKQRVAIGRALLAKPRLLLLDEPMAALDADRKAEIAPFLQRLRDDAGVPLVYVSHVEEEVKMLTDTIVYFTDERISKVETSHD